MERIVTFKIDKGLLEHLNAFANSNKTYRSEIIKDAIQSFLQKFEINDVGEIEGDLIPITFKLDTNILMRLDSLAIKYRLSRSALIRIAIVQYLKQKENEKRTQQTTVEEP